VGSGQSRKKFGAAQMCSCFMGAMVIVLQVALRRSNQLAWQGLPKSVNGNSTWMEDDN
jgi:hypothetical protein